MRTGLEISGKKKPEVLNAHISNETLNKFIHSKFLGFTSHSILHSILNRAERQTLLPYITASEESFRNSPDSFPSTYLQVYLQTPMLPKY